MEGGAILNKIRLENSAHYKSLPRDLFEVNGAVNFIPCK